MKILFLHLSYPGQFRVLAPALAARGDEVRAFTGIEKSPEAQPGVTVMRYGAGRSASPDTHPWVQQIEDKVIRAEACFQAAGQLKTDGYSPDVIVAHPGWGESLFLKEVWPEARLGVYCEHYFHAEGADSGFDPEFPVTAIPEHGCVVKLGNQVADMHFDIAEAGLSPTRYQAHLFPARFRPKIEVIHDGVDTDLIAPKPSIQVRLSDDLQLSKDDEVVTFINRQFEPLRGCHIFMRALPEILRSRPKARVVLVGGDGGYTYGLKPSDASSWQERCIAEVRPLIPEADWSRIHFVGRVPYATHIALLQLSSVHVYLTYPFVLSWSLIEAMSAGCAIVGSDTAPVREVIRHGETGRLVDFFDVAGLAREVSTLLGDPAQRARLGAAARAQALAEYDLKTVCLPRQIAWVDRLANS